MRLGNRIYRVWEELELPKYFLNLHKIDFKSNANLTPPHRYDILLKTIFDLK